MKKTLFIVLPVVLIFAAAPIAGACIEGFSTEPTNEIIENVLSEQGIEYFAEVDCDQVLESTFEKVGEAVMSFMHPSEEEHTLMDEMMDGEASESLETMHISMGERYFGCPVDDLFGGISMMGSGDMMGGFGMMTDTNYGGFNPTLLTTMHGLDGSFMMGSTWRDEYRDSDDDFEHGHHDMMDNGWWIVMPISFFVFFVLLAIYMIRSSHNHQLASNRAAIDILHTRYAKGEIDDEEFEKRKKALNKIS